MAELPPGLTPEMMANLAAFLANQPIKDMYVRPSGTLPQNQIRGYNPRYVYSYKEFPKALTPPPTIVKNEAHERTLRVQWGTPLPWNSGEGDGRETIAGYYAGQDYPKEVPTPQVIVYTAQEEAAKLAEWRAAHGGEGAHPATPYPKWLFHPDKPAIYVMTSDQEVGLGPNWFDTPKAAQDAVKSKVRPDVRTEIQATTTRPGMVNGRYSLDEEAERIDLMARADRLSVTFHPQWGTPRLKREVEEAESKARETEAA